MSESDAVLFANEAFYLAFASRDVDAMEGVWATAEPVACIHPGWQALIGREAVLDSWRGILSNPDSPPVRCHNARALVLGDAALVLCYEEVGGAVLVATNTFRREGRAWKLVHHQAGPCQTPPPPEAEPESGPLQ